MEAWFGPRITHIFFTHYVWLTATVGLVYIYMFRFLSKGIKVMPICG